VCVFIRLIFISAFYRVYHYQKTTSATLGLIFAGSECDKGVNSYTMDVVVCVKYFLFVAKLIEFNEYNYNISVTRSSKCYQVW